MTQPLTDDQVRQFLEDIGLPQVDPTQFRSSTLDEILRASIDMGRIRPMMLTTSVNVSLYTTALAVGLFLDLVAPAPNQIIHCRNMSIEMTNANSEVIRVQKVAGPIVNLLWTDEKAPIPLGQYIGTDNTASQAWGALGLNNIVVFGQDPEFSNLQQILQLNLATIGASLKTATITFSADIYEWEDWPGQVA